MSYKTGETPQKNDEVLGLVNEQPARGRVLGVRAEGKLLITRRAAYGGPGAPLTSEHVEVQDATLSLVYRPRSATPGAVAVPQVAEKAVAAKGSKKAAKEAAKE